MAAQFAELDAHKLITAIADAGLTLRYLHEHETIGWKAFPSLIPMPDGQFALPDGQPKFPLSFSVSASKAQKTGAECRRNADAVQVGPQRKRTTR